MQAPADGQQVPEGDRRLRERGRHHAQEQRHDADYDPFAAFTKSDVQNDTALVERVIASFKAAKASDRRAFCAYVLLKKRES